VKRYHRKFEWQSQPNVSCVIPPWKSKKSLDYGLIRRRGSKRKTPEDTEDIKRSRFGSHQSLVGFAIRRAMTRIEVVAYGGTSNARHRSRIANPTRLWWLQPRSLDILRIFWSFSFDLVFLDQTIINDFFDFQAE